MKTNHILSLSLLTMTFSACGKDSADEACISACEAASVWRDNCGGSGDCEENCKESIEALGGDSCKDEQIAYFDCMAGISWGAVGCSEEDLIYAIANECYSEAEDAGECAGGGSGGGDDYYDTGSW